MNFFLGTVILVAATWVFYGILSALGVDNAGNIAAYAALAIGGVAALVIWFQDQQAKANVKICPECRMQVPGEASICGHCRHQF